MPAEFNSDRVVFYPPTDLACGAFRERAGQLLGALPDKAEDVNQAIELWQCALTAKQFPMFFELDESELDEVASCAEKRAFAYIGKAVKQLPCKDVFDSVELQYTTLFWELLVKANAYKQVTGGDIAEIVASYPSTIHDILMQKQLVIFFPGELRQAMLDHASLSAKLIISAFGTKDTQKRALYLPACLTDADKDSIMHSFLQEEEPNLNYVRVLASWPGSANQYYKPSNDVLVAAQRRSKELNESLFEEGSGIVHAIGIAYSPTQIACKGMRCEDDGYTYMYSTQWMSKYTDNATILNNFIYIYDYLDPKTRLLTFPAHRHERTTLLEALGMHVAGEYHHSIGFNLRHNHAFLAAFSYSMLLEELGIRLEDAIEWFFNTYVEEEFGIEGFSASLPTKETTWLDKCKSIGPEIERVLTAYRVYVSKGYIDDAYFPLMPFKLFSDVESLIQNKYLVEGPKFMESSNLLFSDQSPLAFSKNHKESEQQFFSMMVKEHVVREDFPDIYQHTIEWLLAEGLVTEAENGRLMPSDEACALRKVWNEGAIPRYLLSEKDLAIAESLVESEALMVYDSLFSPDESDYMNFIFNDASFTDSWGLRNKYDHASFAVKDANGKDIHEDYCRLLVLLIGILLKINDELCFITGKGGVESFVDWPLYDGSIFDAAKSILG